MKKLIQTLKNIWSIDELRSKIIVTLALVFTYRLGTHIVLPGLNPNLLANAQANASKNGLLGLFDTFAGGAFSRLVVPAPVFQWRTQPGRGREWLRWHCLVGARGRVRDRARRRTLDSYSTAPVTTTR